MPRYWTIYSGEADGGYRQELCVTAPSPAASRLLAGSDRTVPVHAPGASGVDTQFPSPRRVLHVEMGRHFYGGAQQVVHLIAGLQARGIESSLICSCDSAIAKRLSGHPVHIHEIPFGGDFDWPVMRRIASVARQEQPDLIHLHSRRGADCYGGLAGRWGGWPVVMSRRVDNPEKKWAVPLKYRLYDRVVAISHAIERVLTECGVPTAKLRCVPSGIDPAPFAGPADRQWVCQQWQVDPGDWLVGMVAQFIPRKGHHILLAAMEQLATRHPRLKVILFGQGPRQEEFRQKAKAAGLESQIKLAGFRRDLDKILPALDLVVHPALAEGLGVALLQTSAAGVPIVGTRAGGIPEIVRHEQNGLLVPPGDPAALAAAIERLLGDADLRRQMGERGRELVRREFSLDRMVEGNLAVYEELLAATQVKLRRAS